MTDKGKHTDHKNFFSKIEIPYSETKDDIWNKLSEEIDVKENGRLKAIKSRNRFVWYAAAACVSLLLGIAGFMRFYSVELNAPDGQHLAANLPDGSKVHLNAQTVLTYHPYWWKFSRELNLKGEAFFEVETGKKFSVKSETGTTEVLGTSFNIYARKKLYKVHCISGKVKVSTRSGETNILKPMQSVNVYDQKTFKIQDEENIENAVAWIDNKFIFTRVPLQDVFEEIERQFDIKIKLDDEIKDLYTGNFQRGSSPDEIIDIICKPFGLKYNKSSNTDFFIHKK